VSEVFNWFDPAMRVDPYPTLARFRARCPVQRTELGWWLLGHAEASLAARDGRFNRDHEAFRASHRRTLGDGPAFEYVTRRLTYYGPPDHQRLRGTVSRAFTHSRIKAMRPYVERLAGELFDRVAGEPTFDIVEHVAHRLPSLVICEMLGVPEAERAHFDQWTQRIAHLISPELSAEQFEVGTAAVIEEWACIEELVEERRRTPGDDLLTALLQAEEEGQRLTREELVANVIFLFSAGHQTTRDTFAMGLLALLRHPDQYATLVADPSLAAVATEECLRYDAPVSLALQQALVDVELAGEAISAGDMVMLVLPAANRDPRRFEEPDRFWIERPDNHHLAFSGGPHLCLGAPLARLEVSVLLEAVARRFPHLELASEELTWRDSSVFRGPVALWVRP